jgi:CDP-diacylglycerol--glycerol-3-phosphate 3-phosphatidyltransferase
MSEGIFAYWPNRITALRFVGSLVLFFVLSVWGDSDPEAIAGCLDLSFWLFIGIAATDYLDGYLARRGNQITSFGRIADPFVDKVLVIGTMVFLAVLEWSRPWFPAWIVVAVVAREFLVTGIRGYVESLGGQFPADLFGKVKMFTQCFACAAVIGLSAFEMPSETHGFWTAMTEVFVIATVVTSVGSAVSYMVKTRKVLAESAG